MSLHVLYWGMLSQKLNELFHFLIKYLPIYTTSLRLVSVFLSTFIQQGHIKLVKNNSKYIYNITKDLYFK